MMVLLPLHGQTVVGHVVDEATGESLGFASVQYKDRKISVITDLNGRFTIQRIKGAKLTVSVMGYKTRTFDITGDTEKLFVSLKQDTKALKEVTVKAKRSRYRRKNNPAVELMRQVIAHKKKTDLSNRDYYQYTKYQKLTLALNDVKPEQVQKFSKHKWLVDQVETCEQTGKLILPASVDETVTQKIYRKKPHDEKDIVKGQKSAGINDFFQTGDMLNVVSKDVFTDVNIYDDQVRLLQHPFTSPIGSGAISFYRYYIEDTLKVDCDSCIHVHFLPNNQQDFGFRGDLYILKDSSYQVKRCELILPNQTDVNFVESLKVVQEFQQLPSGEWVLSVDDMIVELVLFDFIQKGVAIRSTRLTDYQFDEIADKLFKGREKTVVEPDAAMQDEAFWQEHRKVQLTKSEDSMGDFLTRMSKQKGFKWVVWGLKLFTENFIETGQKSKVDIGPVLSTLSNNFIDGLRMRAGAQTTANLSPHLFWKGYVAHGMKSHNTYYSSNITWSLNKKKYLPDEFPKRNISFLSTYDVATPSDKFLSTDKDNMFTAFRWMKVDKMEFYRRQQLTLEREERWGFRTALSLKSEKNWAGGNMTFDSFRTTELRAEIEYSPGALYTNSKQRRLKVNRDAPIITLSHTLGMKGFLGGDYRYHYTEASIFKRLWLSSWGRIDFYTRGGVMWSRVPFPLLCVPASNLSYFSQKQTFNLLSSMEFLNDRFVSVDVNWDMQGKILNRIPLIRKLHLREYIGAKMLWGGLSSKNNPTLERNQGSPLLMPFPEGSNIMDSHRPYWEISAGVRGILRFFQVEYVRRMNYYEHTRAPKNSVRFGFTLMF